MISESDSYEYRVVSVDSLDAGTSASLDRTAMSAPIPGHFLNEDVARDVAEQIGRERGLTMKVQRRLLPDPRPWEDR